MWLAREISPHVMPGDPGNYCLMLQKTSVRIMPQSKAWPGEVNSAADTTFSSKPFKVG